MKLQRNQVNPAETQPASHRYPTSHQNKKNIGHPVHDSIAQAPPQRMDLHVETAKLDSPDTYYSDSDDEGLKSSSSDEILTANPEAPQKNRHILERQESNGISIALQKAHLKSPTGPTFQMGLFKIGPNVNKLFSSFREECVRGKQPFHQALADKQVSPKEWAQYLVNANAIWECAGNSALREDSNVSSGFTRLNQHPHAARSLECLKSSGVSIPKSPTPSVKELIDHITKDPKFGDANAFLFNGMGLVFGEQIAKNVTEINKESWHLENYTPIVFNYGSDAATMSLGNSYFHALEKSLLFSSDEMLADQQEHLKKTFELYTATLNEIELKGSSQHKVDLTTTTSSLLSLISQAPSQTANFLGSFIPNSIAFWRNTAKT